MNLILGACPSRACVSDVDYPEDLLFFSMFPLDVVERVFVVLLAIPQPELDDGQVDAMRVDLSSAE